MADREKVKKGLYQHCEGSMFDRCGECPYYEVADEPFQCRDALLMDAFELMREQEPVAHAAWLCKETSTAYDLYGVKTWAAKYKCSKCGSTHRAIEAHMSSYSYCPNCGARMDEEAKEGGSECG